MEINDAYLNKTSCRLLRNAVSFARRGKEEKRERGQKIKMDERPQELSSASLLSREEKEEGGISKRHRSEMSSHRTGCLRREEREGGGILCPLLLLLPTRCATRPITRGTRERYAPDPQAVFLPPSPISVPRINHIRSGRSVIPGIGMQWSNKTAPAHMYAERQQHNIQFERGPLLAVLAVQQTYIEKDLK